MFKITHKNTIRCLMANNIIIENIKSKEDLDEILKEIRRKEIRGYLKKNYTKKHKNVCANRYALQHILPQIVN